MPPTPEEPWARAEVDRRVAELRAKRVEAWFRALVEQELREPRAERAQMNGPVTLMVPPLSVQN